MKRLPIVFASLLLALAFPTRMIHAQTDSEEGHSPSGSTAPPRADRITLQDGLTAEPSSEQPRPIGPKPEAAEDIRLIFLRESSVLLKPAQFELEAGLEYQRTRRVTPEVQSDLQRFLAIPVNLRAGVMHRLEVFATLPLVYGYREYSDYTTTDEETNGSATPTQRARETTDDDLGIGDISGGVSYQLVTESGRWPGIIGSLRVSAPTGSDPYGDEPGVGLGSGHLTAGARVQFVRTLDPVVLFWGLDYAHAFEESYSGHAYQPGEVFGYNMGLGFGINPNVSLSGQFLGSYRGTFEVDGREIEGSSQEPFSLRLGVTARWLQDLYIEPSITFGLNDDAPDASIALALINRFDFR